VLTAVEALCDARSDGADSSQAEGLAGRTMAHSVLRVGLLPQRLWMNAEGEGIDLSGLGAAAGQLSPQPVPYWDGVGTDEMRLARKRMAMAGGRHRPALASAEVGVPG